MKYQILRNGELIAEFIDGDDRDICLEFLKEKYPHYIHTSFEKEV
jgi:hypothetical protein